MVGQEVKLRQPRESKVNSHISKKAVLLVFLVFAIAFSILSARLIIAVNEWSENNKIVTQSPVLVDIRTPVYVTKREPLRVLSPIVEEPEEELNPIEQKIYDLWGERYFLLALSTFKCESRLNPEAVNWVTKDIGVAQINYPTWKDEIEQEFGYTLADLFDYDKNLEVAYWIWDRADGETGNSQGSFKPWVVYSQGNFVGCID